MRAPVWPSSARRGTWFRWRVAPGPAPAMGTPHHRQPMQVPLSDSLGDTQCVVPRSRVCFANSPNSLAEAGGKTFRAFGFALAHLGAPAVKLWMGEHFGPSANIFPELGLCWRCGAISANVCLCLRFRPTLGGFSKNWWIWGPSSVRPARDPQHRPPRHRRACPGIGRISAELGQVGAEFDEFRPNWPMSSPKRSNLVRNRPTLAPEFEDA